MRWCVDGPGELIHACFRKTSCCTCKRMFSSLLDNASHAGLVLLRKCCYQKQACTNLLSSWAGARSQLQSIGRDADTLAELLIGFVARWPCCNEQARITSILDS